MNTGRRRAALAAAVLLVGTAACVVAGVVIARHAAYLRHQRELLVIRRPTADVESGYVEFGA